MIPEGIYMYNNISNISHWYPHRIKIHCWWSSKNQLLLIFVDGRCLISLLPHWGFCFGPQVGLWAAWYCGFFGSLCWFKVKPVKKGLNILWFLCQSHFFFWHTLLFFLCFPAFLMFFPTCFIKDQTQWTRTVDYLHVVTTLSTNEPNMLKKKQKKATPVFFCANQPKTS